MKKRIFSLILSLTVAVALFLPVAAYAASTDVSTEVDAEYVFDVYGLLTNSEQRKLENRAEEISEQYGCGVYIVIVDDYEDYAYYVETAAEYIYMTGTMTLLPMDMATPPLPTTAKRGWRRSSRMTSAATIGTTGSTTI